MNEPDKVPSLRELFVCFFFNFLFHSQASLVAQSVKNLFAV